MLKCTLTEAPRLPAWEGPREGVQDHGCRRGRCADTTDTMTLDQIERWIGNHIKPASAPISR